ncbi:MAG: translocation/assembly module TamB [Pseudooceanicola sp.]|nr:translocation/assembly module TamB [Pseudooceanicola sp.]
MRLLASLLLALSCLATPSFAQDDESGGFIADLLQNALSGENRNVRVIGLEGALSTRATLRQLTVSDDEGVWLTIENAVLDWSRSALLRGNLQVQTLSAERIAVARRPGVTTDPDLPTPEAQPFALPELPVSVTIQDISVDRLELAEPVAGRAADLTFKGALSLIDGALDADVALTRIDRPGDQITLKADYSNSSRELALDLAVIEDADGLFTEILNIPDRPSLELTTRGAGPISDVGIDITLATDDVERIAGQIRLTEEEDGSDQPGTAFSAELAGDLTPLIDPSYHEFFGNSAQLAVSGRRGGDGSFDLPEFSLAANALNLTGALTTDAAGKIRRADLTGSIEPPEGETVVLPAGTPPMSVSGANIALQFDADASNGWTLDADLRSLARVDFEAERAQLTGRGTLDQTGAPRLVGTITAQLDGLALVNPALDRAVGSSLALSGNVDWQSGGAVQLDGFELTGTDYAARVTGRVDGLDTGFRLTGEAEVEADDLSRFSDLAGRDLSGAANATLRGTGSPPGGDFDLQLAAETRDLTTGIAQLNAITGGNTSLALDAMRDETGTTLRSFDLTGEALEATASGTIRSTASDFDFRARLDDLARIVPQSPGPVTLSGDLRHQGEVVNARVQFRAPDATTANITATLQADGAADIDYIATVNGLEKFVPALNGTLQSTGIARRSTEAGWTVTAKTSGSAGITGDFQADFSESTGDLALAFDAAFERLERLVPQVVGTLAADGKATRSGAGAWDVEAQTSGSAGLIGTLAATYDEPTGAARTEFDTTVERIERFVPQLAGSLTTVGTANRAPDTTWTAAIDTGGTAGLSGNFRGSFTETTGALDVFFDAAFDRVQAFMPDLAGGIAAKGRARRFEEKTWQVNAVAEGSAGLSGTFRAIYDEASTDAQLYFDAALERIQRLVPDFAGKLTAAGEAARAGNVWSLDAMATGPGGIEADLYGTYDQAANRADVTARGQAQLGLANAVIRPNSITGTARFDLALNGTPGLNALSGTITANGASVAIPAVGQAITGLDTSVRLGSGSAQINASGGLRAGGRFTVSGPVGLSVPFNAGLAIALQNIVLTDNLSYTSTANGALRFDGGLTGGGTIGGQITFGETEINIAAVSGAIGTAPIPTIRHIGESGATRRTRARAGLLDQGGGASAAYGLDLVLNAPSRIFVRGRGLNAELGGSVRVGGTTANVVPSGQIGLIRGYMDILGRRLTLTEGSVSMQGRLEPYLNFAATTSTSEGEATLAVTGPASTPRIEVTSVPERPSEEALAMLLFGDKFTDLSPLKLAQLGAQLATLSGRGGGFLDKVRQGLGVDNLDLGTDDDGRAQVGLGGYISDNVYTDVTINAEGDSEVNLNLDLTKELTIKGSVNNTGETGLGLFFQRDY